MFSDLDEALRDLLIADVPIERGEVDIEFDRPTREWSSRLSKPTLNLFLYDIRERAGFRDDTVYREQVGEQIVRRRPPKRIDCSYIVTAWAKEAADEHRILAHVMSSLYRHGVVPEQHLRGELEGSEYDVHLRMGAPDHLAKPADFWGVMDNELRASLVWIATVPLDAFRPFSTPMVRTGLFAIGTPREEWRERFITVGGSLRQREAPNAPVEGATVSVAGTALRVVTTEDGHFQFSNIVPGSYTVRVDAPGREVTEVPLDVPSENYDIEL